MSSLSLCEPTREHVHARLQRIADIVASKDLLLNDNLEATEKWGFRWVVLVIASPFCWLCCYDVFLHVRIHSVIIKLTNYLEQNRRHLGEYGRQPVWREEIAFISERIIAPLKERTHYKHNDGLDLVLRYHLFLEGVEDGEARRAVERAEMARQATEFDAGLTRREAEHDATHAAKMAELDAMYVAKMAALEAERERLEAVLAAKRSAQDKRLSGSGGV